MYECFGHSSTGWYIPARPVGSRVAWQHTAFNLLVARLNVSGEALHNSWRKRKKGRKKTWWICGCYSYIRPPLLYFQLNVNGQRQKTKKGMNTGNRDRDLRLKQGKMWDCVCVYICAYFQAGRKLFVDFALIIASFVLDHILISIIK